MRTVVVALAALMLAGVGPAAAWEPAAGPTFNTPRPWGTDTGKYRIVRKIEAAINKAPAGSTVRIASYLMDRKPSVDALLAACRRGVSVRVVLDGHIDNAQAQRLVSNLNGDNVVDRNNDGLVDPPLTGSCGGDLPGPATADPLVGNQVAGSTNDVTDERATWGVDGSYVTVCQGACRGGGTDMHAKFYTFSKTGTATNVVMVSSSNLNAGGAISGWNDLYTMKSVSADAFKTYSDVHLEMTDDHGNPGGDWAKVTDGPYTSRFFPWTGATQADDPVIKDLDKVGCHGANGPTRLNVMMFFWKGDRGDYIATKLLNLARAGCVVSIIYGAPSNDMETRLRAAAKSHLINLYDSRWDLNPDVDGVEVRTHMKYILINGRYAGHAQSWQVMTGTANWVPGTLAFSDENTLNIASRGAFSKYHDNWIRVRNHSRKVPFRH